MDDLEAIIRDREEILFQGKVFAISSTNDVGPFDVLSGHANFISTIKEKLVIHKTKNEKQEMSIDGGVLRVKENKVEIYLGI